MNYPFCKWMLAVVALLECVSSVGGAETNRPLRAVISTNYVVVTNIVIVTNYVAELVDSKTDPTSPTVRSSSTNRIVMISNEATNLPPAPMQDNADWIQLKSGEWLRGKLRGLQELSLEFDSDKLKDQGFDWKDVTQLFSPQALCLYGDQQIAVGMVHVSGDKVVISSTNEVRFSRSELQSMSPGGLKESDFWSGKFSLGVAVKGGNTKEADLSSTLTLRRRTPNTDLKLDYLGNYSELDGEENVNNHRATLYYDVFLTRKLFVRPFFGEYYRDAFQNIAHRGTVGVGCGYYIFLRPDMEWLISGGPAYQYTVFDTVEAGGDPSTSTPAAVFGSRFEKDLTKSISISLSYQAIVTSHAAGALTHHSVSTLSIDLTRRLDLDVSVVWDRTEEPQENADGTTPQKNDFRLNLSLGVQF